MNYSGIGRFILRNLSTKFACKNLASPLKARFELIKYDNSNEDDIKNAHLFISEMSKFSRCVQVMRNTSLSREKILSAHKQLGGIEFGKYRINEVSLGKIGMKNFFLPPKSKHIPLKIFEWITLYNSKNSLNELGTLKSYFSFLNIHPFTDGNGRFSRALLLKSPYNLSLLPLYIYSSKGNGHNELVRDIQPSVENQILVTDYYNSFNYWGNSFLGQSNAVIKKYVDYFLKKIKNQNLKNSDKEKIVYLLSSYYFLETEENINLLKRSRIYNELVCISTSTHKVYFHPESAEMYSSLQKFII